MIISISGGSGAGKSTVSRRLAEVLPNSLLITGDNYMCENSKKLETKIFQKLKIEKEPDIFSYNYYFSSFENVKSWISTIEKDVVSNIENEINTKENKEYIIVDWCFLPLCDFFGQCDFKICITADKDRKEKRLTERLLDKDKSKYDRNDIPLDLYKPEMYLNRIEYTDLSDKGFDFDYYINNNSTVEDLENRINEVVKEIKNFSGYLSTSFNI